jgi:tetratricopeptide (TPR) repeat protein
MKKILYILLGVLFINRVFAFDANATFAKANEAYAQEMYAEAIDFYQQVITIGYESAELYFNLGNAYFKQNEIPSAILYYEKAKKLKPNDEDIDFNLNVANTKIVDKIEPVPELFLWQWWRGIYNLFSADAWAKISVGCMILFFILFGFYLFSKLMMIRKTAFYAGIVILFFTLFTFIVAYQKYHLLTAQQEAIVFTPTITIKSSPNPNSVDLFVLHEGSKVKIIEHVGEWSEIKIANGSVGWLPTASLKNI